MQRPDPIGGVKLALLPKKNRGDAVQMRLTLRYGNAENLKGFTAAGRMLPELMTAGHEVDDAPADRGRARQELRPARRRHGRPDDADGRRRRRRGQHHVRARNQASQSPGRPGDPPPDPPRADVARGRVRGPQARDASPASSRAAPTRCGWASTASSEPSAPYPSDDVRYVPTIDEQLERTRKAHARAGPHAVPRVPRRRSRRARGRRRLRALRDPAHPRRRPSKAGRPRSPTPGSSSRSRRA